MKCPMIMIGGGSRSWYPDREQDSCIKEECAWWHEGNQCCAILTIAQGSVYAHKALLDIARKTPLGNGMRL